MSMPLMALEVRLEPDIVLARQRARQIAGLLGFVALDQTRIATATSEIARNAFQYAGGGRVEFAVEPSPPALLIRVRERGPGIRDLQAILGGQYDSPTGMGLGIAGAKRLMDRFDVESTPGGGATVSMAKLMPRRTAPLTAQDLGRVAESLARNAPQGLLEELQVQNQELLATLEQLREQQAEIARMHNRELEETNRGVVALYSELDESSKAIQRLSDLKSRFLSEMSHELRSPLNSIKSLTGFLLGRSDGDLTSEQEKQVRFIRNAAEGLATLVDDLLDLAKVEAGKAAIRLDTFSVADLFEGLRGTIRPTIDATAVNLVFEDPSEIAPLHTDEGKVTQILRNFLSNAVKFTERGEIRVAAAPGPGETVVFSVADTGLGIAREDRARIFEEFGQIENPLQAKVKGTGLGLPLARKLAELLGGTVSVQSEPGVGSTFFTAIPRTYRPPPQGEAAPGPRWELDPARAPVLVVEDHLPTLMLYERQLSAKGYQVVPARTLREARLALEGWRPAAVILDILLDGEDGWSLLIELKARPATRSIPVFVVTAVDNRERAAALGADDFCLKPIPPDWLLERLRALKASGPSATVLLVDDQESDRYILRGLLAALGRFDIIEAVDGREALLLARRQHPRVVFLDLILPDMTGYEVIERLQADAVTRSIPVIINSSRILDGAERGMLASKSVGILEKGGGSREDAMVRIRDCLGKAGLHAFAEEAQS